MRVADLVIVIEKLERHPTAKQTVAMVFGTVSRISQLWMAMHCMSLSGYVIWNKITKMEADTVDSDALHGMNVCGE